MSTEEWIALLTPFIGIGLMLVVLRIHDKITGFPYGKGKGK
ncbi:hypothetical protein SAMN02982989_2539 [Xaviernesmea oryzae]|uniref:Uncharacterized protein n=1 Tax=Xaviernesmea oryzae TaxID=464029 RepID=A0A1X7F9B4_9HYPH|nr:hypothetical protein [Xaviernesmea oryzae]SMF48354.1 hypothetical protein SAMN02982989_2539 [Xaviernesmea oryzae]